MTRTILAAALCAAYLQVPPAPARAATADADQHLISVDEDTRSVARARDIGREGLCARMMIKLQQGGLPDEPGRRLAESFRSTCADIGH